MPGTRPSRATCGFAARWISRIIENSAANSTPLRMPNSSTPRNAATATQNSRRLSIHTRRSSSTFTRPLTATSTIAASTTFGRLASRPVRNSRHARIASEANDQRQRRARAGAIVDGRLRQAAGDRIALGDASGEVRGAECEQFLARVDLVAVLARERACRGHALDVREQEAGERERDHAVDVARAQRGKVKLGQAGGNRADGLEARLRQRRDAQHDDRGDDHEQRDRARGRVLLAEQQHGDGHESERQHHEVGVAELRAEDPHALEEMLAAALDAEQLRQLRHRDGQRRAGLEAEQHRLADEVDQRRQAQRPGDHADQRDHHRGQQRDLGGALRIAGRHGGERGSDQHGDRRGRPDGELSRGAEQRVGESGDHVAIDAEVRGQSGERGVGERHRNRIRRERDAGDRVVTQPRRLVLRQPVERRHDAAQPSAALARSQRRLSHRRVRGSGARRRPRGAAAAAGRSS